MNGQKTWVDRLVTPWAAASCLSVIGLLAYWNALDNPLMFDDGLSIHANPTLSAEPLIPDALWAPHENPLAGRPIVNLSFALNYSADGENPFGYHLVNLILHIVNAWLLYGVVSRTLQMPVLAERFSDRARHIAFIVALFWLIHPLQTEVINYVTQRTEIVLGTFYLLTFYAAIRAWERPIGWTVVSAISCGLGMLSKESMVTAPVMVVLFDIACSGQSLRAIWQRRWPLYVSLASTWIVLATVMASGPRSGSVGFGRGVAWWEYSLTQCWAIGRYLWLTIWPADLLVDYGVVPQTAVGDFLPGAVAIGVLLLLAGWLWRRNRPASFAILAFFLLLAPTSSVVPIVTEMGAERRVYLPLACLTTLAICVVEFFWRSRMADKRIPIPAAIALVVGIGCLLSIRTRFRNADYAQPVIYWQHAAETVPENYRALCNWGVALIDAEEWEDARKLLAQSLEIRPDNAEAMVNLAKVCAKLKRYPEAIEYADQAAENKLDAVGWLTVGNAYRPSGEVEKAIAAYRQAIRLKGHFSEAHNNLGTLLARTDPQAALPHLQAAISANPDNDGAYLNLGNALARLGHYDDAIDSYRKALQVNPGNATARGNIGIVLQMQREATANRAK